MKDLGERPKAKNFKLIPVSGIGHDLILGWVRIEADWDAAKEPKNGRTALVLAQSAT